MVVIEEDSAAPIAGVRVLARSGEQVLESSTDAAGVALFNDVGLLHSVTVLPNGYEWHTLLGDARDVVIATRPIRTDDVIAAANATFNFDDVTTLGDIKVAGGGMSLADLSRLSVPALLGGLEDVRMVLEGVTDAEGEDVELPWGSVFELSNERLKGDALFVGAQGLRIPWGLGGRVRLSEVGDIFSVDIAAGEGLLPLATVVDMMSVFGKADHVIAPVVELETRPLLGEVGSPYGELPSVQLHGEDALRLDTLTSARVAVTAPRLPCSPTSPACLEDGTESELLVALLADVPGRGSVPLGFVVGRDVDQGSSQTVRDGLVEGRFQSEQQPLPAGVLSLKTAPPHDGLEGSPLVLAAFSMGPTISGVPSVTGVLVRMTIVPESASFGRQLLPYPRALVSGQTITLDDVGAQLTRLELHSDDVTWHIWSPHEAGTIELASLLPDDVTVPTGELALSALVLKDESLTPASLFDLGRGGASGWQQQLRAWSTVGCGPESSCVVE